MIRLGTLLLFICVAAQVTQTLSYEQCLIVPFQSNPPFPSSACWGDSYNVKFYLKTVLNATVFFTGKPTYQLSIVLYTEGYTFSIVLSDEIGEPGSNIGYDGVYVFTPEVPQNNSIRAAACNTTNKIVPPGLYAPSGWTMSDPCNLNMPRIFNTFDTITDVTIDIAYSKNYPLPCLNTGVYGQARYMGPNGDPHHNPEGYAVVCVDAWPQ
jgi:hypothetical protein